MIPYGRVWMHCRGEDACIDPNRSPSRTKYSNARQILTPTMNGAAPRRCHRANFLFRAQCVHLRIRHHRAGPSLLLHAGEPPPVPPPEPPTVPPPVPVPRPPLHPVTIILCPYPGYPRWYHHCGMQVQHPPIPLPCLAICASPYPAIRTFLTPTMHAYPAIRTFLTPAMHIPNQCTTLPYSLNPNSN